MGWSRQTPDPAEEIRHQQNVAIAFGGALVAIGLAGLTTAAVFYIADTHNAGALWFKGLWIGGAGLVIFGLYPLAAVPILGAPFPKPRSNFILRPMWDRMPFSKSARHKRSVAHFQASERVFRERLQREVQAAGLDAGRAAQTLLEEVVEPRPWPRAVWIHSGVIGYGSSGNIARTTAVSADDPEVVEMLRRFKELAATARTWPEFLDWQRLKRDS
jgi:hypothetical protein